MHKLTILLLPILALAQYDAYRRDRSPAVPGHSFDDSKQTNTPYSFEPVDQSYGVFHVEGEYLRWKYFIDNYPVGAKGQIATVPNSPLNPQFLETEIVKVKFDYDSGFRIEAGYTFPSIEWDLIGTWTRFHSSSSLFFTADGVNGAFLPSWGISLGRIALGGFEETLPINASAKLNIDFDCVDVLLGRFFFIGRSFAFKPLMGLSLCWIDERGNYDYAGQSTAPLGNTYLADIVTLRNDASCIGIKAGSNLRLVIPYGFSFFGDIFVSLLAASFKADRTERVTFSAAATVADDTARNHSHLHMGALDFAVGLKWGTSIYKKAYFDVHVGFEEQFFFNFNQSPTMSTGNAPPQAQMVLPLIGNLGMHGLIAGGNLYF